MKIAVPHENGRIFEHFGRAKEFKIYTAEDNAPLTSEVVTFEDVSHEAVAHALKAKGVTLVICSGIGDGAREAIEAEHMLLYTAVDGEADAVIQSFLDGTLEYSEGSSCAEHEESGCGGSCGGCAGCAGCGGGEPAEPYVETRTFTEIVTLTEENFGAEVMDDPGLIVIDFWAEWCGPCRMMAPIFAELNLEQPQIKFCKVNCDEQPTLAGMFGITSIPTLAVVQNRRTINGMIGLRDKKDINAMLEACKAGGGAR